MALDTASFLSNDEYDKCFPAQVHLCRYREEGEPEDKFTIWFVLDSQAVVLLEAIESDNTLRLQLSYHDKDTLATPDERLIYHCAGAPDRLSTHRSGRRMEKYKAQIRTTFTGVTAYYMVQIAGHTYGRLHLMTLVLTDLKRATYLTTHQSTAAFHSEYVQGFLLFVSQRPYNAATMIEKAPRAQQEALGKEIPLGEVRGEEFNDFVRTELGPIDQIVDAILRGKMKLFDALARSLDLDYTTKDLIVTARSYFEEAEKLEFKADAIFYVTCLTILLRLKRVDATASTAYQHGNWWTPGTADV